MFDQTIMTDEKFIALNIDDIVEWANQITGEWNGDEPGTQEDRAHQADEIIEKALELRELILGMEQL